MGEEDGARETRKQERPGTGKAESQGERRRKGDQRREGIREREKEQVINWGGVGAPQTQTGDTGPSQALDSTSLGH